MSAASGDQGGMIKLLDVEKNKVISGTSMQSPICSLGFKKQGHGFHLLCATNTNILLWDIRQKVAKCLELSTKNRLTTVAVTGSNESKVAAGCADGKILIWDIRTGFIDKVFSKHHSRVTSLGFPSSGNELAGGFQDGSLTICDIALMEEQVSRSEMVATSPVTSLEFSRNPTKFFDGAMGMISRLDLVDMNKMKLERMTGKAVL